MIVVAVQNGKHVYVYGAGKKLLFMKNGELCGYTSNSVSIKCTNNIIYTYNERGSLICTNNAR